MGTPPLGTRNQRHLGWLLLACAVCSGCAVANDTSRVFYQAKRTTHIEPRFYRYLRSDRRAQGEARKLAKEAWNEFRANEAVPRSGDFQNGFIEGFADFLYRGGSGEPPAIPPRGYWNLRFLNPHGKASTEEWFDGFRAGVADCKARGLREMWVIPTSVYADSDNGGAASSQTKGGWDKTLNDDLASDLSELEGTRPPVTKRIFGHLTDRTETNPDRAGAPPATVPQDPSPTIEDLSPGVEIHLDQPTPSESFGPPLRMTIDDEMVKETSATEHASVTEHAPQTQAALEAALLRGPTTRGKSAPRPTRGQRAAPEPSVTAPMKLVFEAPPGTQPPDQPPPPGDALRLRQGNGPRRFMRSPPVAPEPMAAELPLRLHGQSEDASAPAPARQPIELPRLVKTPPQPESPPPSDAGTSQLRIRD